MLNPIDKPRGKLLLADGTRFDGFLEGTGTTPVCGEVVFNTSMTGYQEVITDPSYAGQLIVMTYPQIGNYGVSPGDSEGQTCAARALIVRELSPFFSPGPGRTGIREFLLGNNLTCLSGIDTRAVTQRVRSGGAVMGIVAPAKVPDEDLIRAARAHEYSTGESLVSSVTGSSRNRISPRRPAVSGRAALIDLGAKQSIIDEISALGIEIGIFSMDFSADEIISGDYDFLVLSNGPGDPTDVPQVIRSIERLIGEMPILGICLGHQITALALGGSTYKMKFGHRGANQPVICRRTGRVAITSQNHGYAVSDSIERSAGIEITYINGNDGTVEGFSALRYGIECVQFHPEAGPGPRDTLHLFEEFIGSVKGSSYATVA
jgi:carbamoyl-phosphate synthase small subunit